MSGALFHFYSILDGNSCKQTVLLCSAASDLGLHCFPRSQKGAVRLIWVNEDPFMSSALANWTSLFLTVCIKQFLLIQSEIKMKKYTRLPSNWK